MADEIRTGSGSSSPQLAPWLVGPVEHIGSTAVPGLAAKPVIDIMAGVQARETSRPAIAAATELGYGYWPYQADVEHWFCKPSPAQPRRKVSRRGTVGATRRTTFEDHVCRANKDRRSDVFSAD